jgi:hypothetical protein
LLSTGIAPVQLTAIMPMVSGGVVVRYGLSLQSQPEEAIVPGLFAPEPGAILVGREAWYLMRRHVQTHPHGIVMGWRLNGQLAQVLLGDLDFGAPIHVLIYASPNTTIPAAKASGLLMGERAEPIPPLLAQYLPVVSDLDRFIGPLDKSRIA